MQQIQYPTKSYVLDILKNSTLNCGGASVNLNAQTPRNGYMVSTFGREKIVQLSTFSEKAIFDYIEEHTELLEANSKYFVGTRVNDGNVYLDISENVGSFSLAKQLGKKNKQLAIYDVENSLAIDLIY